MKKRTTEEFINQVKLLSPDIEVLGQYTGYKKPVKVRCLVCGKEWETSAGNLLMGRGCKECRIKIFTKSRTKTNEDFLKELLEINPEIIPLEQYINSHTKIQVQCKICGYLWKSKPKDLLHGYGCRKCSKKMAAESRKLTKEEVLDRLSKNNQNIELLDEYIDLNEVIKVRCKCCGNTWETKVKNILYGRGCKICSLLRRSNSRRKSQEQFVLDVKQVLPTVNIKGEYKNSSTPVECECMVCGFLWDALPESLITGHGCRRCSRSGTSFMEQFILYSFIEVFGENEVKSRSRSAIGKELDIYVPSHKFAIEPGTWAFHKNSIDRDSEKRKLCENMNIRLITVYDSFPIDEEPPFDSDCIVFEDDYNISDHANIKNLVCKLFELLGIMVSFTDKQWIKIEENAYQSARAKNTEDFVEEIKAIRSDIDIIGTYVGSKIPIKTRCNKCGLIWSPRPAALLHNSGCPVCSKKLNTKRQTKTHEQFVSQLKEIQPSIEIIGKYIKGKEHILVKCCVCGTEWNPVAASLLNGEGCPECGKIKKADGRRKTQEQYEMELLVVNPDLEVIGKYIGTIYPVRVRCKVCGYEWEKTARKILANPHHKNEKNMHKQPERLEITHPQSQ